MSKNTEQDLCKFCRLPKQSDAKAASLTQWILVCTCNEGIPKDDYESIVCEACGKTKRHNIRGSLTQWILGTDTCRCDIPFEISLVPKSKTIVKREDEPELEVDDFPSDRFKPISIIGKGGSSRVYLCKDRLLDKHVAVKCLSQLTKKLTVEFQKEAKLTTELNHPHIATVLDFGATDKSTPYMVLEYVAGVDLSECIKQEWPLEENVFCDIIKQILNGLEHAHSKNIFHHDLKPENIIISKNEKGLIVKIIDFGASKKHTAQEKSEQIAGTPLYMAPDQFRGEGYDIQSEIYSLGCILYEMLTRRPPFDGNSSLAVMKKHASEPVPAINSDNLPYKQIAGYVRIANKCLEKNKSDRYNSVSEIARELKLQLSTPVTDSTEPEKREYINKHPSAVPIVLGCFFILFLSIYAASLVFTPDKPASKPKINPARVFALNKNNYYYAPVKKEECTDKNLKFVTPEMKKLDLSGTSIDGSGLKYLSKNDVHLTHLNITDTFISDKNLRYLKGMNSLKKLNLSLTRVSDKGLRNMGDLKITEIHLLDASATTDDAIPIIADQFPQIQKLTFGNTNTTSESLKQLKKLKSLSNLKLLASGVNDETIDYLISLKLEKLVLSGCNALTDRGLIKFKYDRGLKDLELKNCLRTTDRGIQKLSIANPSLYVHRKVTLQTPGDSKTTGKKTVQSKSELFMRNMNQYVTPVNLAGFKDEFIKFVKPETRLLSLAFTQIDGSGLKYLVKNKVKVTHLKLNGTFISDKNLEHLQNLKSLKFLSLSGTQISDQGLKNLGKLKLNNLYLLGTTGVTDKAIPIIVEQFPTLKKFSFGNAKTTTKSVPPMKDLKSLTKLSLYKSGLNDDNIDCLTELKLKVIHLIECTKLTDAGLLKLQKTKGLRKVILEDCTSITPEGVRKLKKLKPRLDIEIVTSKSNFEL